MKKKFYQFLKDNNILTEFLLNCSAKGTCDFLGLKVFKKKNPKSWIDSAFLWKGTSEGHDYWRNLHGKWQSLIQE
jgi:hypothetical protein